MLYADALIALLSSDASRMRALETVRSLALPDCWIGAGFVRDAVWDHLHGYEPVLPAGDVDVIWFDPENQAPAFDIDQETHLKSIAPGLDWSVKNQARMHCRNGDAPYRSVAEAMTYWPETATAIAVRVTLAGNVEINAPLGLEDLYLLRLVPTANFAIRKRAIFDERIVKKRWLERYPSLRSA